MPTPNETALIDTVAALHGRMLSSYRRTAKLATVLTIVALGIFALVDDRHANAWVFSAIMIGFLAAVWIHYALTSFRVRKGYFGNNAAEALEEIEFIQQSLRRGGTIKK